MCRFYALPYRTGRSPPPPCCSRSPRQPYGPRNNRSSAPIPGWWSATPPSSDKTGHLVTTLTQDAFTVFENGVVQPIKVFRREDVPVSLGLIIDNSGSMRDKRAKVEAAALALVKDSNPDDEVFIVNFNDEAFLDIPHGKDFTNDIKEMEEALTRIDSRGGTAMRDAIRMSIDHLKEKAHKDKKVLVVVTDGNDNSSVVSLENLVKASQQSEVLIYGIGLLGEEERREAQRAQRALKALADATGGEVFFPKDVAEVDKIAHQVAQRHPQPVHHRILAVQHRHGRHLPSDQDHRQGSGQSHGPHAQRLLRHARPGWAIQARRKRAGIEIIMRSFILCFLMAAVLLAQQPQDAAAIFRADTRIVVCHTTVIDKAGHLVTTLPQSAFSVFENKVKQEIRKFKREDVPVSLGLVIDNSGSMRNKLTKVEAAALALVKESNRDDEVFIVNFNDTAYLDNPKDKDFTNDIGELETALGRIDARGGTAMRDAISMSIEHLKKAPPR